MGDLTNLKYRGGTPWSAAHDPDDNMGTIDTAITSKDKVITALGSMVDADGDYSARSTTNYIDSNSDVDEDLTDLDTQLKATQDEVDAVEGALGAMISSAGAYVAHAGTNYIDGNADTTEDLTDLDGAIGDVVDGTTARTGVVKNTQNVGVLGTGVTAVEAGDGMHHVTTLTLTDVDLGAIAGAGNLAVGALIYTFPAGVHKHSVTYSSVSLTGDAAIQADTPDCGLGSVIGSGAVAVLGGTATFEDYVGGSAAADCNGTALTVGPTGATAGIHTGISLNAAGDTKTLHYNAAANWSGASAALLANGTVVLEWTTLA